MRLHMASLSFVALGSVKATDWGKMSQYKSTLEKPPPLTGNTIWLSGQDDQGFDVAFSQDTQSRVEGVLEGCGTIDNDCYRDVLKTLQSADLSLDNKKERRHLGHLISKTFKGAWGIGANIATMLLLNWYIKSDKMDNSAFHIPLSKAQEAAGSASATSVVHSAGGSLVITLTPTLAPTTLTGSMAPSITTAASDTTGMKKGDLLATMDNDLARRFDEIAHRMTECEDGRTFDSKYSSRRRAASTYGQALCASEGIIAMSGKGGTMADLALLSHDKIGMELSQGAEKAKEAFVVLKDFIQAYSPALSLPQDSIDQFGIYILAIVINALVIEQTSVGPVNVIHPEIAVTYDAMKSRPTSTSASITSSATQCPDPTTSPLLCGFVDQSDCKVQLPDRMAIGKSEAVCNDSKWKGCTCSTPVMLFENVVGVEEFKGIQAALALFDELKSHPKVRQAKVACRNHPLSAPRNDKDAGGGPSVEKAIDDWCKNNDGKEVDSDGFYSRWGITRLGVPGRSSFFLRARRTCNSADKFSRWECKRALIVAMDQCDKGTETRGITASVACLDYSIDLSGVTYDGMPPWAENKQGRRFPPPEDAEKRGGGGPGHAPNCTKGVGERPLAEVDLNRAIDAFCQNGKEIQGYGQYWANMFHFPPKNEPQFYPDQGYKMYLSIGAETIQNGGEEPYQDMGWCRNYDWKLGRDDCTYALRKLYSTCTKDPAENLNGGEYTYRCVKYKSWPVNTR